MTTLHACQIDYKHFGCDTTTSMCFNNLIVIISGRALLLQKDFYGVTHTTTCTLCCWADQCRPSTLITTRCHQPILRHGGVCLLPSIFPFFLKHICFLYVLYRIDAANFEALLKRIAFKAIVSVMFPSLFYSMVRVVPRHTQLAESVWKTERVD